MKIDLDKARELDLTPIKVYVDGVKIPNVSEFDVVEGYVVEAKPDGKRVTRKGVVTTDKDHLLIAKPVVALETSEKVIEWKEGDVCYANGVMWSNLDTAHKALKFDDFQLNEPREGYYIPKSELDTEEKYNQAVKVFGLFGHYLDSVSDGFEGMDYHNKLVVFEDGVLLNSLDVAKVKLTYNQLMAIGEFKRKQSEKESIVKPVPVTDESPDNDLNSGGSCDYYKAPIENPTTATDKYIAECNDIIEALDMTYAEANMFKEIWRTAAARTLGKKKANHTSKRGAEKIIFFAERHGVKHGVKL